MYRGFGENFEFDLMGLEYCFSFIKSAKVIKILFIDLDKQIRVKPRVQVG